MIDFVHTSILKCVAALNFLQFLQYFFVVEGVRSWLVLLEFHDLISEGSAWGTEELTTPALEGLTPVRVRDVLRSMHKASALGYLVGEVFLLLLAWSTAHSDAVLNVKNGCTIQRVSERLILHSAGNEADAKPSDGKGPVQVFLARRLLDFVPHMH